ncbi:helix-turn-helix transcriptional regulator [Nocardia xishanensis]
MSRNRELGEFLRNQRARRLPEPGAVWSGNRRVPGMRREEVAQLAGMSVDYYVRLEQGRIGAVSEEVLDAVAGALRLTDTERAHLFRLAARRRSTLGREHRALIDPGLQRLLDSWPTTPAHILDHRMNVVAANDLCIGLFAGAGWDLSGESNGARLVFLDPAAREFYLEWAEKAESIVTYLRLAAGRHPGDTELSALVGELVVASPEFATLWAAHRVAEKGSGTMRVRHPVVGVVALLFHGFPVPGDTDLTLVTFTPAAAADEEAIRLLGSWTAPEPSFDERESLVAEADPAVRRDIG